MTVSITEKDFAIPRGSVATVFPVGTSVTARIALGFVNEYVTRGRIPR